MTYFSESLGGFIPAAWKNDGTYTTETWPADAVLLTDEESDRYWRQPAPVGKKLGSSGGRPAWVDIPPPSPPTRAQVEAQRLRAYADPLIGSDRYFAEAQREGLIGNAEAAEVAKALGLARFAEIQAEHPWPAE
ncbi:hypothetical protein [Stutzerimonas decontaminans]|uniref:Phage tail protein n=1 Tax=Stutzerimonas stutzeri TaxID=316 RepID=A0A023WVR1_STUST|nr:hypothetical protein [Stutzerimonas decontaminans]AHY43815.1 phage tail protein [Stutzerimonas decontaminans]